MGSLAPAVKFVAIVYKHEAGLPMGEHALVGLRHPKDNF